jgi:hypothetical protein
MGIVDPIYCIDETHPPLHPFVNHDTGNVYFECLNCEFKFTPGINNYNALRNIILGVSVGQETPIVPDTDFDE